MAPGHYAMTPEHVLERVDENTIFVVPTLGVTYTGAYEPVKEIADALDRLQAETGLDVDIHVDAASGGFLAPFCAPDLVWDFRLPRVKSISASGHKFGLAPLGVGWVVWRDAGRAARRPDLPRELPRRRHAGVPDQLLAARRAGRRAVLRLRAARARGLPADPRRLLRDRPDARRGDPDARAVRDPLRQRPADRHPDRDLADRRRARTPATRCSTWPTGCGCGAGRCRPTRSPGRRRTSRCSASCVRQGVSRDMAAILLDDLADAIAHLHKHPVTVPMTTEESSGFNHL